MENKSAEFTEEVRASDPPISSMSISFYCKEGGVDSKRYYLTLDSPHPFDISKILFPVDAGVGQLTQKVTIMYNPLVPDFTAGPHEILISFPSYDIPPFDPTGGPSEECPPLTAINKELEIEEVLGSNTTRPPKLKYDKAQHKG